MHCREAFNMCFSESNTSLAFTPLQERSSWDIPPCEDFASRRPRGRIGPRAQECPLCSSKLKTYYDLYLRYILQCHGKAPIESQARSRSLTAIATPQRSLDSSPVNCTSSLQHAQLHASRGNEDGGHATSRIDARQVQG